MKQCISHIAIITIALCLELTGCAPAPVAPPVARDNTPTPPTPQNQCFKEGEAICVLCSAIPEEGLHYGYIVCSGGQWVQQGFCGQYDKAC
jgi:hypothetical protein